MKIIYFSSNRLPETVIDYQKPKLILQVVSESLNLNFKSCNRLLPLCNRVPVTEFLKFKLKRHGSSLNNCVIDYQRFVIDYQWENFKNNSEKSHPFMSFRKIIKDLYICDLCSNIFVSYSTTYVYFSLISPSSYFLYSIL